VDALPALVNPHTGRLHTSFNQTIAATGRLSSSDPNLQNIPMRTDMGREIRQAFLPAAGWQLVTADYSQVELRLLAHFSHDEGLREAFRRGDDIHRRTAAEVWQVAPEDVSAEQRARAKAVNFGIIYGLSSFGLANQLGIIVDRKRRPTAGHRVADAIHGKSGAPGAQYHCGNEYEETRFHLAGLIARQRREDKSLHLDRVADLHPQCPRRVAAVHGDFEEAAGTENGQRLVCGNFLVELAHLAELPALRRHGPFALSEPCKRSAVDIGNRVAEMVDVNDLAEQALQFRLWLRPR